MLLFSDSMTDLAVNLASAKVSAAMGRLGKLQTITSEEVDEAIEQLIIEMAWEKTMEALQGSASRLIQAQIVKGGGITANIPRSIAARFSFDVADDRAVLWAEAQAGALIREIDDETRTAIKKIVVDSLKGGYSGDDAAEMVSRIIGLNTRQTRAVENLYQNTVKSLTEDGVSSRQARARAKKMAAEYRERLIEYRGKMIARTEIMRAANNGRLLSWAQALDDGLIASTMLKEWRTYPGFGARGPCPICLDLRGSTVEVFAEFPNGSMMPPAHPFCRCTSILVPPTRGTTRTAQVGGGYLGPIDPIGAVLSQEVDSTVEKANPYHDPKTGRFTHAPTGGRKVDIDPIEENHSLTGTPNYETGKAKGTITIERVEGTGGEAADDWISAYTGSRRGRNQNAVENEIDVSRETQRDWYKSSEEEQAASAVLMGLTGTQKTPPHLAYGAIASRPAALQLHTAVSASKRSQPSLFRGIREPLVGSVDGEPQTPRVGDSMVLPLTSFSRDRKVAFGFSKEIVGYYQPQAIQSAPKLRDGSTMVRIRPGSRGYSLSRAGLEDDKNVVLDEREVISAGRFRVTGTAVIRVTHPDLPGPREMTIVDLEHTDVWNPDTSALEPLTIAKAKFRDFGGSLAHLFVGRQTESELGSVEKANPYHDPRTGRFTFAPANDMGGGSVGGTPMGEREAFAARMRKAREDLGDIDYTTAPPEGIAGESGEAEMLQKQIEFGHLVREEIDRRREIAAQDPVLQAQRKKLEDELEAARREVEGMNRQKVDWEHDSLERRDKISRERFWEQRDKSSAYQDFRKELDAASADARTKSEDSWKLRQDLESQFSSESGPKPGEGYWEWTRRKNEWIESQPSYQRARREHEAAEALVYQKRRWLDEVDRFGATPKDLYGDEGPGSRTPLRVSDDNPLKADKALMDALEAHVSDRAALSTYVSERNARWSAALARRKEAAAEVSAFDGNTQRRVVKETLEDAGVEFSDGRVVFSHSFRDSDFDSGSIIMLGQKRSKAVRSIEEVAAYVPKRWAQDIQMAHKERGKSGLTIKFDRNKRGKFGNFEILTDGNNTSLHELMHAVEASSDRVPRFERAFYRYRTRGETEVRLKDLRPKSGYKADEWTKPDKFYNPYVGKTYGTRYHELLTMTYADMMYQRGEAGFAKLDPELQAWLWSTVILA